VVVFYTPEAVVYITLKVKVPVALPLIVRTLLLSIKAPAGKVLKIISLGPVHAPIMAEFNLKSLVKTLAEVI
jgi:hypothetical protein